MDTTIPSETRMPTPSEEQRISAVEGGGSIWFNSLRYYRERAGLTLRQAADRVGCKPQNLWRAEKKGKGLHRTKWHGFARLYKTTSEDLELPRIPPSAHKNLPPISS